MDKIVEDLGKQAEEKHRFLNKKQELINILTIATRMLGIGIWHYHLNKKAMDWNDRMFQIYGSTREQFLCTYENWTKVVHPDDLAHVQRAINRCITGHSDYEVEFRIIHPSGAIRHIEALGTAISDKGVTQYITGINLDVTERKEVEETLKEKENILRQITNNVPALIAHIDSDLNYQFGNKNYERWLGIRSEELLGKHVRNVLGDTLYLTLKEKYALVLAGEQVQFEYPVRFVDNEIHWVSANYVPDISDSGEVKGFFALGTDISECKKAEEQIKIAATAFEIEDGIVITDCEGTILRVNRAFTTITGYTSEEIVGRNPRFLQSGYHDEAFYRTMWNTIKSTGQWQGEVFDKRKNGEVYPQWLTISAVTDNSGKVTHYVGIHTDITVHKQAEEKIRNLAFYDPLTNLPNRTLFHDRFNQTMAISHRGGRYGALLLIDLDNFKMLNDTFGHAEGDKLLQNIAEHLKDTVREGDTVSRQGGDEFMILLPALSVMKHDAGKAAGMVAEKIRLVISQCSSAGNVSHHSTASIGIVLFEGTESSIEDLIKWADLAMYKAKSSGRDAVYFFDPTMETALLERMRLEVDLRVAVEEKQFLIYYQVQVDNQGRPTGVEALVRWSHPEQGMITPANFIPLAEETGQILLIGQWVLEKACAQLVEWAIRPEMAHLTVSVNVSAKQFFQSDYVDQVLAVLDDTGANPERLKLELTESMLAENIEGIIETMLKLKAEGVRCSLDDFGTGYSSLSYLSRLPLEQLKIDLAFVRNMLTDKNSVAIAKTIVALGESLDMEVLAEGVETKSQQELLASLGCHRYQGYLFGRPIPVEEFEEFMRGV